MTRLEEIAARKQQLIAQSDTERNQMVRTYYRYQARTTTARQVKNILKNPFVLATIGILVLKMPWRRAYRMSGWLWGGWRLLRTIRRFI